MPPSRFKPIRPHEPTTRGWVVDDSENDRSKRDVSIRRLSTACKECQRRRTKCTSGNPCLECKKRNILCIFDESSDKRRKTYSNKIEQELSHYQEFLSDFLEAIRLSDDDDVHHIINIVRSGSSTSKIHIEVTLILAGNFLAGNNPSQPAG